MTTKFKPALDRKDEIRTERSSKFWAPVRMSADCFNCANRFFHGQNSPFPAASGDVVVYAASTKRAKEFAGTLNALLAADIGIARWDAVAV